MRAMISRSALCLVGARKMKLVSKCVPLSRETMAFRVEERFRSEGISRVRVRVRARDSSLDLLYKSKES